MGDSHRSEKLVQGPVGSESQSPSVMTVIPTVVLSPSAETVWRKEWPPGRDVRSGREGGEAVTWHGAELRLGCVSGPRPQRCREMVPVEVCARTRWQLDSPVGRTPGRTPLN